VVGGTGLRGLISRSHQNGVKPYDTSGTNFLAPHKSPRLRTKKEHVMKTYQKRKRMTFGDFVTVVYDACGQRRARGIVRHAVNMHLVVFRGQHRYLIS
jgi:hypothetical protein